MRRCSRSVRRGTCRGRSRHPRRHRRRSRADRAAQVGDVGDAGVDDGDGDAVAVEAVGGVVRALPAIEEELSSCRRRSSTGLPRWRRRPAPATCWAPRRRRRRRRTAGARPRRRRRAAAWTGWSGRVPAPSAHQASCCTIGPAAGAVEPGAGRRGRRKHQGDGESGDDSERATTERTVESELAER